MKTKIFLTILIMIMLASNAFAADCSAINRDPSPLGVGPDFTAMTYTASTITTTDELANMNNGIIALSVGAYVADTCSLTNIQVMEGIKLESENFYQTAVTYDSINTIYAPASNVVTSTFASKASDELRFVCLDMDTNTKTGGKVNRADGFTFEVLGSTAVDPSTGYIYGAANTIDGDFAVFSVDPATSTIIASNLVSHDTQAVEASGVTFVNGNLAISGYVDDNAAIFTINNLVTLAIKGTYKLNVAVPESTTTGTRTSTVTGNSLVAVNVATATGDLVALKADVAVNGDITPSGYRMPTVGGEIWQVINNVETSKDSGKIIVAGTTFIGPLGPHGAYVEFETNFFDDLGGARTTGIGSEITDATGGGPGDIITIGNNGNNGFVAKFTNTGTLVSSGTELGTSFTSIVQVNMVHMTLYVIGGEEGNSALWLILNDAMNEVEKLTQSLSVGVGSMTTNGVGNTIGDEFYSSQFGSYGNAAFVQGGGNYPAPAPEFSLTTLLLATLLAGGLVLFVVRRKYK